MLVHDTEQSHWDQHVQNDALAHKADHFHGEDVRDKRLIGSFSKVPLKPAGTVVLRSAL